MSRFQFGCKIIFSCDHVMEFISLTLKPFGVSLYGDCFQPPSEQSQLHFLQILFVNNLQCNVALKFKWEPQKSRTAMENAQFTIPRLLFQKHRFINSLCERSRVISILLYVIVFYSQLVYIIVRNVLLYPCVQETPHLVVCKQLSVNRYITV